MRRLPQSTRVLGGGPRTRHSDAMKHSDRTGGSIVRMMRRRSRQIEASAVAGRGPVLVIAPFCLLALFLIWLAVRLVWDVSYWWFVLGYVAAGVLLFVRPIQAFVLTPLFGARRPTDDELARMFPLWRGIALANELPPDRYILRVLPSDELNAFACGGHLVVVTTFASPSCRGGARRGPRPRAEPPPRTAHGWLDDRPLAVIARGPARPRGLRAAERRDRGHQRLRLGVAGADPARPARGRAAQRPVAAVRRHALRRPMRSATSSPIAPSSRPTGGSCGWAMAATCRKRCAV